MYRLTTTARVFLVLGILCLNSIVLADQQTEIENKAEFKKLVLQRNQLHAKLLQLDSKAAQAVKREQDPAQINAKQITTQDRMDLIQLRLETMAVRYGFVIPPLPQRPSQGTNSDSRLKDDSRYGRDVFKRGRDRTKKELKNQTLRFLASIDFSRFIQKVKKD